MTEDDVSAGETGAGEDATPRLGDEGLRLEPGPSPLGVHSEVGPLRRVMVHRPDLSLRRLTPRNRRELLFDEVLWVARAGDHHDVFVTVLRDRGIEVLHLERLLAEVLEDEGARAWVVDRRVNELRQGLLAGDLRRALMDADPGDLARHLIGGMTRAELPFRPRGLLAASAPDTHFVLQPLPNHLFTRDTSAWIYDGLLVSHMALPARSQEVVHLRAVYRFHPAFRQVDFPVWGGDQDRDYTPASIEGGDVMVVGKGTVLVGMGERTSPQAVELLARRLFGAGAARRVIAVTLPPLRQYMHLDTVMTMIDRDAFCIFPGIAREMPAWSLRPAGGEGGGGGSSGGAHLAGGPAGGAGAAGGRSAGDGSGLPGGGGTSGRSGEGTPAAADGGSGRMGEALGAGAETVVGGIRVTPEPDLFAALADALEVERVRVLTTGGDEYQAEREQWDDGNNVLAVAPGVVVGYDRNVDTNRTLEAAGIEVLTVPGSELGRGRGGARCMSCPLWRERA